VVDPTCCVAAADPAGLVTVRWQPLPPQPPGTLGFLPAPPPAVEILIDPVPGRGEQLASELRELLAAAVLPYTPDELNGIQAAMPLLRRYSTPNPAAFEGWALIFRDHFLEHSVGFVLAMERAGVPPEWIYVLDKGDRTAGRDRVRATFAARGYRTGLLDNTAINAPENHAAALADTETAIDTFLDAAHAAGRRVGACWPAATASRTRGGGSMPRWS
jgi:adenosylhomocysteinase